METDLDDIDYAAKDELDDGVQKSVGEETYLGSKLLNRRTRQFHLQLDGVRNPLGTRWGSRPSVCTG